VVTPRIRLQILAADRAESAHYPSATRWGGTAGFMAVFWAAFLICTLGGGRDSAVAVFYAYLDACVPVMNLTSCCSYRRTGTCIWRTW